MVEKAKTAVLITGARGVLGRALVKRLRAHYKVVALTHKGCDITDSKKVASVFTRFRPRIVIHTAAFTDVDGCQKDSKKAYAVNTQGTCNIARNAKSAGSIVIYLSTDYVFNGRKKSPYREEDAAYPLSIYGTTKLRAEKCIKQLVKKHIIIRTSWIFGQGKTGFVDKVLAQAKSSQHLKIVSDKYTSPTYAVDLAEALAKIINLIDSNKWKDKFYGTYHISNSGFCSWYGYAKFILKSAGLKSTKIEPIPIAEMNFLAKRPLFSVLDNSKYVSVFKSGLRPWQEAVKEYIACTYN